MHYPALPMPINGNTLMMVLAHTGMNKNGTPYTGQIKIRDAVDSIAKQANGDNIPEDGILRIDFGVFPPPILVVTPKLLKSYQSGHLFAAQSTGRVRVVFAARILGAPDALGLPDPSFMFPGMSCYLMSESKPVWSDGSTWRYADGTEVVGLPLPLPEE